MLDGFQFGQDGLLFLAVLLDEVVVHVQDVIISLKVVIFVVVEVVWGDTSFEAILLRLSLRLFQRTASHSLIVDQFVLSSQRLLVLLLLRRRIVRV